MKRRQSPPNPTEVHSPACACLPVAHDLGSAFQSRRDTSEQKAPVALAADACNQEAPRPDVVRQDPATLPVRCGLGPVVNQSRPSTIDEDLSQPGHCGCDSCEVSGQCHRSTQSTW